LGRGEPKLFWVVRNVETPESPLERGDGLNERQFNFFTPSLSRVGRGEQKLEKVLKDEKGASRQALRPKNQFQLVFLKRSFKRSYF
jgi:hypothetical protein